MGITEGVLLCIESSVRRASVASTTATVTSAIATFSEAIAGAAKKAGQRGQQKRKRAVEVQASTSAPALALPTVQAANAPLSPALAATAAATRDAVVAVGRSSRKRTKA